MKCIGVVKVVTVIWRQFFLKFGAAFILIYFTSCDPHHDICTFSYWQIFWHSIWHIFWHSIWHSIWHIFWHMFWHIFWHSSWHIFWHMFWHPIWHSIWHIFWHILWHIFWHSIWHSIWHIFWHMFWHIFWHSIWHIFWHMFWHIFWHSIWHIFWHIIWQIFWDSIWHTLWHSIWHFIWHSICIPSGILSGISSGILTGISSGILSGISSGILSDILSGISSGICSGISSGILSGILSGISSVILSGRWGPAVHTELGRSPVEVQRCTLSWAAPRLRSVYFKHAHKRAYCGLSSANRIYSWGRVGRAVPYLCVKDCEGRSIKTPAEGLQTQDVAVRVKPVHSCAYSSAQDVPVCSKLGRSSAQSRSTHQIRQRLTSLIQARFSQGFAKT